MHSLPNYLFHSPFSYYYFPADHLPLHPNLTHTIYLHSDRSIERVYHFYGFEYILQAPTTLYNLNHLTPPPSIYSRIADLSVSLTQLLARNFHCFIN